MVFVLFSYVYVPFTLPCILLLTINELAFSVEEFMSVSNWTAIKVSMGTLMRFDWGEKFTISWAVAR